jgi:3-dehydroquinate synthase
MLKASRLPTVCPFTAEAMAKIALSDKKRKGDSITLVLPERVGQSRLHAIPAADLAAFFAKGL